MSEGGVHLTDWAMQNRLATALLVLVVVLVLYIWWKCGKAGFVPDAQYNEVSTGNLFMHGNSPYWGFGALNSGRGGSMDDHVKGAQTKYYNMVARAVNDPNTVSGAIAGSVVPEDMVMGSPFPARKEGFSDATDLASFNQTDPMADLKYLRSGPCGWTDTGAAAEVQALTSMGVYGTTPFGGGSFQMLVDETDSLPGPMTQAQWQYQNERTGGL